MHILERMIGFPLPQPDCPENMVTLYHLLRMDFDAFRIYFDADPTCVPSFFIFYYFIQS